MSWPAVWARGPTCPQPVYAREDQPRIDRRAVLWTDAESLARAGPEAVQQDVGLGRQLQQHPRLRLDVQVDDPLTAMQQVAVLRRHRHACLVATRFARLRRACDCHAAGPSHPHHVGAQVGEHHPRVRPGSDAAEFDDLHPGEGSTGRHRR